MRSFQMEIAGHRYWGRWKLESDTTLEVRSDYGTVWRELNGQDPSQLARECLLTMVPRTWRRPRDASRAN